ncbi:MAG: hypothetical protein B7733_04740 [Myxococcales bacterium FL481]|nr:MAG: hypothetical protein B7733_04740 [Myxococcales bacterium FL481]
MPRLSSLPRLPWLIACCSFATFLTACGNEPAPTAATEGGKPPGSAAPSTKAIVPAKSPDSAAPKAPKPGGTDAPAVAMAPSKDPGTAVPKPTGPSQPPPATPADEGSAPSEPATGPTQSELLALVRKKKTSDADAKQHLAQAEKLGASKRKLARAANARGQALVVTPERATPFFEYARQIDPKFPEATFNLAKFAANRGEIPQVKALLREVADRGGKKLLDTIEFDPTFALVANDRDVQALK